MEHINVTPDIRKRLIEGLRHKHPEKTEEELEDAFDEFLGSAWVCGMCDGIISGLVDSCLLCSGMFSDIEADEVEDGVFISEVANDMMKGLN